VRDVIILGSTGSIGTQALDIVRDNPDRFRVVGIGAGRNRELAEAQAAEFGVTNVGFGADDAVALIESTRADVVLNGITGAVGLAPTLAALATGATLALANKESLIIGGALVKDAANPGQLVPVDSEHSALAQALMAGTHAEVAKLVVTASGGPFRGFTREQLADVTPAQAAKHPTWNMGSVITTNSATLVNKGLEVIEAHELFGVDYDRIDVVVHPQSVVHSMVEFVDGATIAQLSMPDMRLPIGLALGAPARLDQPFGAIDWTTLGSLTFEVPDREAFPALDLAYAAGRVGGSAPATFSGANEVAVEAFLDGRITWLDIPAVAAEVLDAGTGNISEVGDVLEADRLARERARSAVDRRAS
jgi:1-deoxy-D-xylulose-5-phosphate reductoisomerase